MTTPNQSALPETSAEAEKVRAPELGAAPRSALWIVASRHPYYPSIDFFATEAEARAAAQKEIEEMHADDGHHDDSSVSVAQVVAHAAIKTHY